jgi:hypothetical protein
MISFSLQEANIERINFDNIVTDASMREHLRYRIPEGKILLNKKGKSKKKKAPQPETTAPGGPPNAASKKKKAS